jgi:hypothetical protein
MMCTKNRTTLPRAGATPSRRGRLPVVVLGSLLALYLARLASAQTAEGGQMTDQELKDFLVYQDALTVKKINEHSAGAR